MKRSEINKALKEMEAMIREYKFALPPFCHMTPQDWENAGHEYDEIRDNLLGFDITDYGLGRFEEVGFSLITIRNGNIKNDKYKKPYAEKLIFITDNCGEIVLDKLLIKTILKEYPQIKAEAIVRGEAVLNDATLKDAKQVGLTAVLPVFGNGTAIAGTCLSRIPQTVMKKIDSADIIIAKGQANFETLRYCGKNIYYIFMCKCQMFADRFGVPKLSGMLLNDLRMK